MRALLLGMIVAAGACTISEAPRLEQRPRWNIGTGERYDAGCVAARAFVRKSGKQGLGLAVQLRSRGDCRVAITGARLAIGGRDLAIPGVAPIDLPGHSQAYAWLPVRFDNNAEWNAGHVDAWLVLAIRIDGAPARDWPVELHDVMHVEAFE